MKSILLQNVTVIDGSGKEPQVSMDILVNEGRISALGRCGSLPIEHQDVEIYSMQGMTLLPGLIDCHVHIFADAGPEGRINSGEPPDLLFYEPLIMLVAHLKQELPLYVTLVGRSIWNLLYVKRLPRVIVMDLGWCWLASYSQ